MPNKTLYTCKMCGSEFLDWSSQRGENVYCSNQCYADYLKTKTPHNKGKTNHISKPCLTCGKPITGEPSKVKRRKFCCQKCAGENNRKTKDIKAYLIERITKIPGKDCWLWNGALNGGYGRPSVDGKHQYAHRLSYEAFVGPIPEGMFLDHLCRNRSCINPDHLEIVTLEENIKRGEAGKGPRSESHKKAVSIATKKRMNDPKARAAQKVILDEARKNPKRLESLRAALKNPEYRKIKSDKMKEIWAERKGKKDVDG